MSYKQNCADEIAKARLTDPDDQLINILFEASTLCNGDYDIHEDTLLSIQGLIAQAYNLGVAR